MRPELTCHSVMANPPVLRPAGPGRDWMDAFTDRHPYRCLPLTMANSTGWELVCDEDVVIAWDGRPGTQHLIVKGAGPGPVRLAKSHFGGGVVTFDSGYLMRTPPGWGVWVTGPPNVCKHGLVPLTGLVETDWLPFTFTMNWRMTAPGHVSFAKGEAFAFIMLVQLDAMEMVQPVIRKISESPDIEAEYLAWRTSRNDFNARLAAADAEATAAGWQKHYTRGVSPAGMVASEHRSKRRLSCPVNHTSTEPV